MLPPAEANAAQHSTQKRLLVLHGLRSEGPRAGRGRGREGSAAPLSPTSGKCQPQISYGSGTYKSKLENAIMYF